MVLLFLLPNSLQITFKYYLALATALCCGNVLSQAAVIRLCDLPRFTKFKHNKKQRVNKRNQGQGSKKRTRESIQIGIKLLPPIPAEQYILSPSFSLIYLPMGYQVTHCHDSMQCYFWHFLFTSFLITYQVSSGRDNKVYPQRNPNCIIALPEQFLNPVAPRTLEQVVSVKPSLLIFPSIGCLCSSLRAYNCNDTIEIHFKR